MNTSMVSNRTLVQSKSKYILIAILVVAALLRFNHVNQPFIDAFSWRQSSTAMMADNYFRTNWNIFFPEVSWGGAGPNYQGREFQTVSYLAAVAYNFVGQHEWVGRSIVSLFGVWGVFALYQLVCRVWDEEHALLGAAVMALLPGSIFIDRSFLPDPAMVALTTTSFWLLVKYLQEGRNRTLITAACIGTLAFLTKIPGLIVGIPMLYAVFAILKKQKRISLKALLPIIISAVCMLIPVISYYLWAKHLSLTYPPYHFAGAGNWVWNDGLNKWLEQGYFLAGLNDRFSVWMFTPFCMFLAFLGFVYPPFESRTQESQTEQLVTAPWVFHWWMIAGIIYYLIGAKELVENPWNFHVINPAASVLIGHAILAIATIWKPAAQKLAYPATLCICIITISLLSQKALVWMYKPYAYESYNMGLAMHEVSQPGDLVVTLANTIGDPIAIYYSGRRGWTFPPSSPDRDWSQLPTDDTESIKLFEELRAQGADWFGVVAGREDFWKYHTDLTKHLDQACKFYQKSENWVIYRIPPLVK